MTPRLERTILRHFPGERARDVDAQALAYHAALLVAFAALCAGALPAWLFVPLGVCLYVRNFNAIHESVHARVDPFDPLRPLRQLAMIVHGPLQLGRDELSSDHRRHHAHPGDPERDPHVAVHSDHWAEGLAQALFQPEIAAVRHLRRVRAVRPGMRRALAYNLATSAALVALGGADIVWWIAATRLGSTACWFIFDYMLHAPGVWGRTDALPMPRHLRALWVALFGRDNLNATRYHTLHHRFAGVRDRDLPALASLIAAEPHHFEARGARPVATRDYAAA